MAWALVGGLLLSGCTSWTEPQPVLGVGSVLTQPIPAHHGPPATWPNGCCDRGVKTTYQPEEPVGPVVTDGAIELNLNFDRAALRQINEAEGVFACSMTLAGRRSAHRLYPTRDQQIAMLHADASRAAAARGGTHFYLDSIDNDIDVWKNVQVITAHYSVYRVKPEGWAQLEAKYRPVSAQ